MLLPAIPLVPLLLLTLPQIIVVLANGPVTMGENPLYKEQRSCAVDCFAAGTLFEDPGERIADRFKCPKPPQNDCVCRVDLQSSANAYISSCVSHWCDGNTLDIDVATSIYDDYCNSNGYTRGVEGPAAATATTTAVNIPVGTSTFVTRPASAIPTSQTQNANSGLSEPTASESSSSSSGVSSGDDDDEAASGTTSAGPSATSSSKLDTGEIVGIAVGAVAVVIAVVTLMINWKSLRVLVKGGAGRG